MVELVIKVSETVVENIQRRSTEIQIDGDVLENAVLNGIQLPKGHGRLVDADVLPEISLFGTTEYINVRKAPTIIEADIESEV